MKATAAIVIPCYNEAERLDGARVLDYLDEHERVRFVMVDDGSTDDTLRLCRRIAADNPDRIDVLALSKNSGKAEAVRRGLVRAAASDCDLIGFWDADLATPLDAIDEFIDAFDARPAVDIVIGARVRLLGREIDRRTARHILGRLFATAASMVLDLPVYDTQCGAKLFRARPEVVALFAEPFISSWIFDVEILARYIAQTGRDGVQDRIYEHPLRRWRDVPGSKLESTDFVRAASELLRIARRYRA